MTEPPENAMDKARFMPCSIAAFAVRTFARVATFMPKNPARIENAAPSRKHTAVPMSMNSAISTNSTTMKIARILYSDFKKALAPSAIAPAISCIRSLPGAAFCT